MDPHRLLRLHRARLRTGDASVLRTRTALGQRRAHRSRALVDAVLSVLLAPSCAACGAILDTPSEGPVCAGCWAGILPITPPLCERCGDPLPTWRLVSQPIGICARCRRLRHAVDRARTLGEYTGPLRAIVHALKYDGRRSIAPRLAAMMRERGDELISDAAFAVPVPLHPSRLRHRGFNQSADLARGLGLPVVHALRRIRATAIQADLPAAQRHRNVRGAFAVTRHSRALATAVVLLVDDVSTTGATLNACAQTLKDAGVREVRALTAARVVTLRR